jgi:hypothetical protein
MTVPKVNVRPVAPGENAAVYHHSLTDERITAGFMGFYLATLDLPPDDPELIELVRIRNAVAQSCEF